MTNTPDRPDLSATRRRSLPPTEDTTPDPVETRRPSPARKKQTKGLGLDISVAHHDMIDALAERFDPPLNKKRYIVERAIAELYEREVGQA